MTKILPLISTILLINCIGEDEVPKDTQLSSAQDAMALWQSNGEPSYSYTIEGTGFSPDAERFVTVKCGVVLEENEKSIPELIQAIVDYDGSCTVTAEFDQGIGYPMVRFDDCGEEGSGYTLKNYAVIEDVCNYPSTRL